MSDVIEIGPQVNIDDVCLVSDDGISNQLDRRMRGPIRSIPERPRLEVSLEDRLQNELQRSLDHAVSNTRR